QIRHAGIPRAIAAVEQPEGAADGSTFRDSRRTIWFNRLNRGRARLGGSQGAADPLRRSVTELTKTGSEAVPATLATEVDRAALLGEMRRVRSSVDLHPAHRIDRRALAPGGARGGGPPQRRPALEVVD